MSTINTDFLPNTTGQNLGSPDQEWDGFFKDIVVTGSINTGPTTSDSVQIITTSQTIGFANSIHTMILAEGGSLPGITLTLPSAVNYSGQVMKIKKTDLSFGPVNIAGFIDGNSSYALTNQYQYVNLEAGNGIWQVVGNN